MMDANGIAENQSTGAKPMDFARKANNPLTGCISRFF